MTEDSPGESAGEFTRQKIMDGAEALFVERGYSATSLRAIATAAGVNLAATNYHFGSKSGLLAAVFHRRMEPVGKERLAALAALEASAEPMTVRAVLEAFFAPLFDAKDPELFTVIPALVGRIFAEPANVAMPMMANEFADVMTRFIAALHAACPTVAEEEIRWRFHLMVGSMIQLLRFQAPLGDEPTEQTLKTGLQALIDFACAGIEQPGGAS